MASYIIEKEGNNTYVIYNVKGERRFHQDTYEVYKMSRANLFEKYAELVELEAEEELEQLIKACSEGKQNHIWVIHSDTNDHYTCNMHIYHALLGDAIEEIYNHAL